MKPAVTVLGSLNVDLVASVTQLPRPGETVSASSLARFFGGKGANQAIAASRQGAAVTIIGCLGGDQAGRDYQSHLRTEGIDVRAIQQDDGSLTGTAMIGVDSKGENLIMVAPGANGKLDKAWVHQHQHTIQQAEILLLQFEVPLEAILEAIRIANEASVPVIVNPSPFNKAFPWGHVSLNTIIVNEGEAAHLTSLPPDQVNTQSGRWFSALRERAIQRLVITRGARPTLALIAETEQILEVPTPSVTPVDTVGAGDAFAGTLAYALSEGIPLESAIAQANAAGALTTLKPGAQEAMPTKLLTMAFLK